MLNISTKPLSSLSYSFRHPLRRVMKEAAAAATAVQTDQTHYCSSQPLSLPKADDEPKAYSEKIKNIVSEISKLTILEVSDLNELLKKTLNISEAPVMAVGAVSAVGQAKEEGEEEVTDAVIKSTFTLTITKYDETKKVPLIKYVKTIMEGMNLVQAKKFVETLPAVVRKDSLQAEVEKLKEELIAIGAECSVD